MLGSGAGAPVLQAADHMPGIGEDPEPVVPEPLVDLVGIPLRIRHRPPPYGIGFGYGSRCARHAPGAESEREADGIRVHE